jgi:hypothetical protein
MNTQDHEAVRDILGFYRDYYAVVTKGGKFSGIPTVFNAYTKEPAGAADIAVTAAIGFMIMKYEHDTKKTEFSHMLKPIAEWLVSMQEAYGNTGLRQIPKAKALKEHPELIQKYAEPNAIAYAFFSNYADTYHAPEYQKAEDRILDWVKSTLWDKEKGMIRYGEGEEGFSADAQSRWLSVLGPERFMREFGMSPEAFARYLARIEEEFAVRVSSAFYLGLDSVSL